MDKKEFDAYIKEYLKENMEIVVNTKDRTGDFGYGDYRDYKEHIIQIKIGDEVICETNFDT